MTGRVLAVQTGRPSLIAWRGTTVSTAIRKQAVQGRVAAGPDGLAGDRQADLSVHGGPDKAICCYPSEHLPALSAWIGQDLPHGAFGENLTLAGLTEDATHIGDVLRVGSVIATVTQPRGPCFKLAARWGVKALPARLAQGLISGFYLKVLEDGDVGAGDAVELVERRSAASVAEVLRVTYRDREDDAAREAVARVPELAPQWRAALAALGARRRMPPGDVHGIGS